MKKIKAFLFFICASISACFAGDATNNVTVEKFDTMRLEKGNVVLDVRTVGEFETGRIPGATNIDYLSSDFVDRVAKLDRAKTYLVYCAGGGRSAKACEKMEMVRITNSFNLIGGFRAWQKAKKPVEQ